MATVEILSSKNPERAIRSYLVEKDLFTGFKLGEFSIFDLTKHLRYRIESYHKVGGKIEVIDQCSKESIANLTNQVNFLSYQGYFSILDSSSDQWIDGSIQRIFHIIKNKYIIKWNGQRIIMRTKFGTLTTTFEHEYHSGVLAKIEKRLIASIWSNKYKLHIFSDDLPDSIYFLALAVKDHHSGRPKG